MEKEAASFQVFPVRAVRFPVQKHTVYRLESTYKKCLREE